MSKAEERAFEYYPNIDRKDYPCKELDAAYRDVFVLGYRQAEKDNELTWENMFDIFGLVNVVLDDYADGKTRKEVGEEILRRFKEKRNGTK